VIPFRKGYTPVKTREEYRDALELQLSRYESQINDRMEWVFNGWVRYKQILKEIKFFKDKALTCRYLLIVG
jgi:hypothetical protein